MRFLTICGSTRHESTTARFLAAFAKTYPEHEWVAAPNLSELPLFTPERLAAGRPKACTVLAKAVETADTVLIATPEYAHNMPAALKSALEWLVASGEFSRKPVIAMSCTPHAPRGEYCMKSLVWTLQALDAQVLAEVPVYGFEKHAQQSDSINEPALREMTDTLMEMVLA